MPKFFAPSTPRAPFVAPERQSDHSQQVIRVRIRARIVDSEALGRHARLVAASNAGYNPNRTVCLIMHFMYDNVHYVLKRSHRRFGRIVPFGRSEAWFAANGAIWFDASPNYPATVPLWQVWSSVALGRFDDALMNLPWWLTGVAFAVAMYGALRMNGLDSLAATVGAWLTSSLPLANVHIALAGYADLPMASYYALAALATWRWSLERSVPSAVMALLFAIACMTIKTPGIVWALTLLPGIVLAVMPQRGPRVVAAAVAAVLLALAVLAQTHPMVLGYRLHLDFAPAWQALVDSLFLLGNWNLLWYAVIAATIVAWPILRTPAFVALSSTMASGVLFLFVAFAFTNARNWVNEQTTVNRAVLHLAPLALAWTIVVVHAWLQRRKQVEAPATLAPASA